MSEILIDKVAKLTIKDFGNNLNRATAIDVTVQFLGDSSESLTKKY